MMNTETVDRLKRLDLQGDRIASSILELLLEFEDADRFYEGIQGRIELKGRASKSKRGME